jgi:hypothetical protein
LIVMLRHIRAILALLCVLSLGAVQSADALSVQRRASLFSSAQSSIPTTPTFGISNTDSVGLVQTGTSFNFPARSIGAADTTRTVVVGVGCEASSGNVTISNVAIGGTSATQASGAASTDSAGGGNTDIWYLATPFLNASTTAIVVTTSGNATRCVIMLYRIVGTSNSFSSAGNSAIGSASAADLPGSGNITVPSGGGITSTIAVHSASQTLTSTNQTMDVSGLVEGGSTYGAGHDTSHAGSSLQYVISWGTSTSYASSIAAFNQ